MSTRQLHAAYASLLSKGRLSTNASQASLVDRLSLLQHTLLNERNNAQGGLYIYGSVGTGKSRLADLFASTLPPAVSKRRVHFHEFMMDIHSRLHRARSLPGYSGDPLVQIGREVRAESRVLAFDEFQVSDIADAMILKRLFGAIWDSGGVMVATSNRHPENLYEKGLNRPLFLPFIAELQRRCEVWKLEGTQDYRMMSPSAGQEGGGGGRVTVFFEDQHDFEDSLRIATHAAPPRPMTIQVMMNRVLQVQSYEHHQKAGNKVVVRATFKDLCEGNLGSADYHALCKAANTLYLSGLYQFKEDQLDFVRRFITLVDLAYESKTRIVCLSAVPLFRLFEKIVPSERAPGPAVQEKVGQMSVRKGGGSSSSMMSTFIGEMEWSATGLREASLASGGAGEIDVKFAIGRAVSRLFEMGSKKYGSLD